jgi:ligand-binding sensor domain-containing protein/signal transduction histidine kinase
MLLLLVSNHIAVSLDAKRTFSQYALDMWREKDGLPQLTINEIYQTKDGYIYIGTNEGLYRFDGIRFMAIKDEARGFVGNEILALEEDNESRLWIGYQGGLARLYKNVITILSEDSEFPKNSSVRALKKDDNGNMWIGFYNQVVKFKNQELTVFDKNGETKINAVTSIHIDKKQGVWVGTDNGLYQIEDQKLVKHSILTKDGNELSKVTSIVSASDESLWLTVKEGFLIRYHNRQFTTYNLRMAPSDILNVNVIHIDTNGNVWIGTKEKGLCRFEDEKLIPYSNSNINFSMSHVVSLFADREGSLWIGTEIDGLLRLRDVEFTAYTTKDGLAGNRVHSLVEDTKGNIWVGSSDGASCITGNVVRNYILHEPTGYPRMITSIAETAEGSMWFATYYGIFSLKDGKFTQVLKDVIDKTEVRLLYKDKTYGLWITTRSKGLIYFKDGKILYTHPNDEGFNFCEDVRTLHLDNSNVLWLGTKNKGLMQLINGQLSSYATRGTIPSNSVTSIYEDSDATLWITTNAGLSRIKDNKFTNYNISNGLITNDLAQILEDNHNNLWISTTSMGVIQLNKRMLNDVAEGKLSNFHRKIYTTRNGLSANNCSINASWKGKDGKLWFGTIKGVIVTDPGKHRINTHIPPVYIEEYLVNKKDLNIKDNIQIQPNHAELEIHYTALSYLIPENVQFKYKLEEFDSDWVEAGSRRVAYYTNLPPGNYRFRVKACNNDGIWNEDGASLVFYVQPHFYQTYWFYMLCITTVMLIAWAVYYLRMRQLRTQLAMVLAERNRIAQEIHDTLIQSIVGIQVQLDAVSVMLFNSPKLAKQQLDSLRILVRNSLDEARNSIWNIRNKRTEEIDLAIALSNFAKELTAGKLTRVKFQAHGQYQQLSETVEKDVFRIGQEAITNAVNHAQAEDILIELKFDYQYLWLCVQDNGCGFDTEAEYSTNNHFGLLGMKERAHRLGAQLTIRSSLGSGTEVSLVVPIN